ncbi:CocE/NonD family hydrolase [Nocardioides pocheonensis]|uniref:CocE/NonD family hydrolase n=1 Tax=Nocardioides pocheonensis TaxID=661485 RepID=A0A3N0GJ17_9ACTN|nr:CocE/NonD family hydrolase [Nocardioides pocheonensis]
MRRPVTALTLLAASALSVGGLALATAPAGTADTLPYTVQTLHFAVTAGAEGPCDIVGDLYTPTAATSASRVPAILTTNGFGGSKDDQAGLGRYFASHGYVVLSYSGLGFGGSGCKITLDDPDLDGAAASDLVGYLGGDAGVAYLDAGHTQSAPALDVVQLDARDHAGVRRSDDPRVGMIGGSYGGQIQFATAAVDARLDTIVPMITWNDLSYSLGPNNTDQLPSQTSGVSSRTSGAAKLFWAAGFSGEGVADGMQGAQGDPNRLYGCPNFADWVCPGLAFAGSAGYVDDSTVAHLRHASVATYLPQVRIPTLLAQGEFDTLFNLNEAVATYRALKAQGTPVKMIWHSWGHSHGTPAPGELSLTDPDPSTQYETARVVAWFDRYLKGADVSTGAEFAYFRDWVPYTGNAAPAYAEAKAFPVGTDRTWYLGSSDLATSPPLAAGSQSFVTPAAGAPTSINPLDAVGGFLPAPLPEQDAPGSFAAWNTATLAQPVNVVGSPRLNLKVDAPVASVGQAGGPAGMLVLFVRLQDVAPDGTVTDIRQLTAPVRIPDVTRPFTVRMPAIAHQFAAGHQIRLVVAGGSVNYRGGQVANAVTITGGGGQTLTLPTVG